MTILDKLFQKIAEKGNLLGMDPTMAKTARDWFRNQAQTLGGRPDPNRLMTAAIEQKEYIAQVNPAKDFGKMLLFFYDAKTKEKLPYWDKFPLVFPFKVAKGGFYGLNMHYLSPYQRAGLMNALYVNTIRNIGRRGKDRPTSTAGQDPYQQRMIFTYQILKKTSSMRGYKACIKHYLSSQVRSRMMVVQPDEWDFVLMLNVAQFVKGGKGTGAGGNFAQSKVFADSIRKIK